MTIHVFVEGPSEVALIEPWSKRLLKGCPVKVHPHEGKGRLPTDIHATPDPRHRGLLDQLPAKLRAFANDTHIHGIVVLVDADDDDCTALRTAIEQAAQTCSPGLRVVARIAIEETEAFYLGDLRALKSAFPDADMDRARDYEPDSICGTWELLGAIVNDDSGDKVGWAERMGKTITTSPEKSRSPSFRALIRALKRLAAPATKPKKPSKGKRHRASKKYRRMSRDRQRSS